MLYGWAWLFAVGELLVGGEVRRLETSLDYERDTALGRNATSVLGFAVLGNGTSGVRVICLCNPPVKANRGAAVLGYLEGG